MELSMEHPQIESSAGRPRAVASAGAVGSIARSLAVRDMVTGYNHEIPHHGRLYHIQTEDSGRAKGRICTHIFHGGVIVASRTVDYDQSCLRADVSDLLKKSHKSMLRRLVHGLLDDAITRCLGAAPTRPKVVHTRAALPVGEQSLTECPEAEAGPKVATRGATDTALRRSAKRANSSTKTASTKTRAETRTTENPADRTNRSAPMRGRDECRPSARHIKGSLDMDNVRQVLKNLMDNVTGAMATALVDYESGMCLGTEGTGLNIEVAAAGNMEVMKAKTRVMQDLGIEGGIQDILITLESQYHIIQPVGASMFLYIAIDRKQGNLALARHKLSSASESVRV
ncbi:MAG: hypothetical protein AAGF11_46230 [Myxococcota bacterium]